MHRATLSLAGEQRAPALARMFVRARLTDWLGADSRGKFTDDLLLVTSELVTNAVVHGREPIELTFALDADEAEVTVTDFGGGYVPNDADLLERGPVRVRNALQFSLNIPSVKVGAINGKVIRRKTVSGPAPSVVAASS